MKKLVLFVSVVALVSVTGLQPVQADDDDDRLAASEELQDAVTVEAIREHQAAFQKAADNNGGVRTSGTPGYDQSVDYIVDQLEDAGYDVDLDVVDFDFFEIVGDPSFEQLAPNAISYVDGTDFAVMSFSGSGSVAGAEFVGVDLSLSDPTLSTSGCESDDFDPAVVDVTGKIAVMQRGACTFALKAANAEAAGAVGAVVFNQGNTPG